MKSLKLNIARIILVLFGVLLFYLSFIWLPDYADYMEQVEPELSYMKWILLIGLEMTSFTVYYAIYKSFKILNLVSRCESNSEMFTKQFKGISKCALFIIGCYLFGIAYIEMNRVLNPMLGLVGIVIIFLTFLVYVVSENISNRVKKSLS